MSDASRFGDHILAVVTQGLVRVAQAEGLDGNELLASAGLSWEAIGNPDTYIPIERHVALGVAITKRMGSVNAGLHSGMAIYGDPRGALGFAIRRSGHHLRALERFRRFLSITNDSVLLSSESGPDGVNLCVDMVTSLGALGHPTEALFSAWVSIARFATGVRWAPMRVAFRHAPWGDPSEHRDFFACPVEFGASRSFLLIGAQSLALPIEATEHPMHGTLENLRARWLEREPMAHYSAVRCVLAELETGQIESRANHDGALLVRAARLLLSGERALPAFEVAFLLGYESVRELLASTSHHDQSI